MYIVKATKSEYMFIVTKHWCSTFQIQVMVINLFWMMFCMLQISVFADEVLEVAYDKSYSKSAWLQVHANWFLNMLSQWLFNLIYSIISFDWNNCLRPNLLMLLWSLFWQSSLSKVDLKATRIGANKVVWNFIAGEF